MKFSNRGLTPAPYCIDDLVMKRAASAFCHRWRDGTPIGNGVTGTLLYGGTSVEHFILNRCDLWYDGEDAPVPDVTDSLQEMRELQKKGDYGAAHQLMYQSLIEKNYGTRLADMRVLGCVRMDTFCQESAKHYRRLLHLDTAEAEIFYRIGENTCVRRNLVSRKYDVTAMEMQSELPLNLSLTSGFFQSFEGNRELRVQESDAASASYRTDGDCHIYSSCNEDKFFGIVFRVVSDGTISVTNAGITVTNARHTLLLIKAFSEEADRAEGERRALEALRACPESYPELYEENKVAHAELYRTAELHLYDGDEFHSNETLLEDARDEQLSPELAEKLWRFGRYLFISGTAKHALPFPLYGIWPCGYERQFTHHVANENVQSIYWHTETGGLSELVVPLINYYCAPERLETCRENARQLFGCRGIFVGTYTTPRNAAVAWYVPVILHFVGVAGWVASHFFRYYQFTGDKALFAEKILPFMMEAALFYEDFHRIDENGALSLYPGVSPENSPWEFHDKTKAHAMPVTKNPTVELAILKELLQNLLSVADEFSIPAERVETWKKLLALIPPYQINEDGAIAEWMAENEHDAYDHRHLSHLYPVFPGTEIEDSGEKELLPAFERAVDLREYGSFCGWSLPHMSSIYSRFGHAEKAYNCLNDLTKVCLLENFFTLGHDYRDMGVTTSDCGDESMACVQFDAILGCVNAVQEMLLFSTPKILRLLPACPAAFSRGKAVLHFVAGTLEMHWDLEQKQCHGIIRAVRDVELTLELPFGAPARKITLSATETLSF